MEEIEMMDCESIHGLLLDLNTRFLLNQEDSFSDTGRYQRMVEKLNYLTKTKPNTYFAVSIL